MPTSSLETSAAARAALERLLAQDYRPASSAYDEMVASNGALRPHWDYMVRSLSTMGAAELAERGEEARRLLRENGVTYNVYDAPKDIQRPWAFDPIPVLLKSQDWSSFESGLIQRAELLNLILADLYGPRNLIRKGLIPPELVYAHPGFLRCCYGMNAGPDRLYVYAADLGRDADGRVWVLGDRTQAPAGAGYALENRIVISRILPSLYRDSQVHRLALFFRTMRATLHSAYQFEQDNPRVVLLTPGPGNEAFFEHAFLANYLGYSLVQGGDLTVRDARVWLKTLEGLQPVHVILRRVDDIFCDPLELRNDSLLGTPGLVEAARAGNVVIANPLGSGILESPALKVFLPRLARELLGEDLQLQSIPTWWCGVDKDRDHVLAHLDQLVIKPIYPHASNPPLYGARLTPKQRETIVERIKSQPHMFVGQQHLELSTTPILAGDRLEPRPMILRSFLVLRDESFAVLPGGLTRVSPSSDSWVVASQHGGVIKDTWVLASEPENPVTLLQPEGRPLPLSRGGGEVPSRVADNLFWLGRYAERTEGIARLLRKLLLRLLDSEVDRHDVCLPVMLRAVINDNSDTLDHARADAPAVFASEQEILSLIVDASNPGSLRFNVDALTNAGRSVRDRLSDDTWRVINGLEEDLNKPQDLNDALECLERLVIGLSAFAGLSAESMTRVQGWRFLDMGRRLERAMHTINLLNEFCVPVREPVGPLWELLLAITDSVMTYRRRYRVRIEAGAVLDLLLHDESNPRSIGYQIVRLQEQVSSLPVRGDSPRRSAEERILLEAVTALRLTDIESLALPTPKSNRRDTLRALLERLYNLLLGLSDAISHAYFDHVETPQQLVDIQ